MALSPINSLLLDIDKAYSRIFVVIYRNCYGRTRVEDMRTGRTIRQCLFVSLTKKPVSVAVNNTIEITVVGQKLWGRGQERYITTKRSQCYRVKVFGCDDSV